MIISMQSQQMVNGITMMVMIGFASGVYQGTSIQTDFDNIMDNINLEESKL